jgi:hypothetical protein
MAKPYRESAAPPPNCAYCSGRKYDPFRLLGGWCPRCGGTGKEPKVARWTEMQIALLAIIAFTAVVGGIIWLRYVSPWAWGER